MISLFGKPEKVEPSLLERLKASVSKTKARLRLALSTAYWPLIWPAPERATLRLRLPGKLTLPVRLAPADEPAISFALRETAADAPKTMLGGGRVERRVGFDLARGRSTYETIAEGGLFGEGAHAYDEIGTSVFTISRAA